MYDTVSRSNGYNCGTSARFGYRSESQFLGKNKNDEQRGGTNEYHSNLLSWSCVRVGVLAAMNRHTRYDLSEVVKPY